MPDQPSTEFEFGWGHDDLGLLFRVDPHGAVSLRSVSPHPGHQPVAPLVSGASLVEVRTVRDGSSAGHQNLHTEIGDRLRYQGHEISSEAGVTRLSLFLTDPISDLAAKVQFVSIEGLSSMTVSTTISNAGTRATTLLAVSSAMVEVVLQSNAEYADHRLWWARNDWTRECRWVSSPIDELLVPDLDRHSYTIDSRRPFGRSGLGSWSSGRYLPMGILDDERTGSALAWQVENPGPWRWEVGDRSRSLCIGIFGPIDNEHQWSQPLGPGETFTTVEATFAVSSAGWQGAIAQLSRTRQARREPHRSFDRKPVVYNDFFSAILGNPNEAKLLPLVDAAAEAGAEVFCIDAGWFDDEADSSSGDAAGGFIWWDSIGEYSVARNRFPNGLETVTQRIRALGMVPGIWFEPEVLGVRSPLCDELPDSAFFVRGGERVVEHGRHQLDFSEPAAHAHIDEVIDAMVVRYGIGYVKLDYNINPGPGSDSGGNSAGAGLLSHSRGIVSWLRAMSARHPELIIENCASGGMRLDGAIQRVTHVQQMTDQSDFLKFVPIAVAAPTAVPPDQAAAWSFPDVTMTRDEIEFTLVTPMLGRYELTGQLLTLSPEQRSLTRGAIDLYKSLRGDIGISQAVWPLGLPAVDDPWLALGQENSRRTLLLVWRRAGADSLVLPLKSLARRVTQAKILFPLGSGGSASLGASATELTVELPRAPMALLVELVHAVPGLVDLAADE